MKIYISAKPKAKNTSITKIDETHFKVSVKEPPEDGKANKAIIKVLSDYFKIPKDQVKIVSGETGKLKILLIDFE